MTYKHSVSDLGERFPRMRSGLTIGAEDELLWEVTAEHVVHLGYPPPSLSEGRIIDAESQPGLSVAVFSTPNMILLMERAARKVLEPFLEPGEVSVGASVQIDHLGGTPLGGRVRGVARVTSVKGRSIDFEVAAFDQHEQIGRGTHRRAVVRLEKVAQRIASKAGATENEKPRRWLDAVSTSPVASAQGSSQAAQAVMDSSRRSASFAPPICDTLQLDVAESIATVTLNRPAKKNAVDVQMTEEWERINRYLADHPEIRVVIVTGAGDAFCAGDDVPEVGQLTIEQAQELSYRQARVYLAWEQLPQVFVAAIDGVALGAGCVMACACDLRIATHRSQFGMPEIWLGWSPGYGIAQLTALVGKARAMELCLTGKLLTAREAQDDGLVHRLTASGNLPSASRKWVDELLSLPAEALRETKRAVHADEGLQPKTAFLADTAAYIRCLQTENAREGIAAFKEKRPPNFR